MAGEKTRREFLQDASLAGAAFVAGAAAISAGGCAGRSPGPGPNQVEFVIVDGNGTLYIRDPDLAQTMFDQLNKNGELGTRFTEEGKRKVHTTGSPKEGDGAEASGSAAMDSTAAIAAVSSTRRSLKGVTVELTAKDEDGGTTTVNSLCGC